MFNQLSIFDYQEVSVRRRDLPPLPAWQDSIAFASIVPEQNRYRSYRLTLIQDLFGDWVVLRSWGRIGKAQRTRGDVFASRDEAVHAAAQLGRRRLVHGYDLPAAV
jgi:predicted DNA-binding WGR domain protein